MLDQSALTAADIMTRDVVTVRPHTSLIHVAKLFAQKHISGAPVTDESGHLVGIVTEADLVRWHDGGTEKQAWWLGMLGEGFNLNPGFLDYVRSEQEKVRTVMHEDVVTVAPNTPLRDIARLIATKGVKRVPVLDGDKLVGIVARSDLVTALAAS